ncbi:hypothetical protein SAMN04489760_10658 [Syntrophus gentianae]|uniref:Uncharacterized protein n=1 Tax=Syntrophus gentianae TaxID=43775 RepID=A0A1H7WD17_9BACT|nr:hypothetical protein SAMN04489760_10658 [Syntrophus gentianae]
MEGVIFFKLAETPAARPESGISLCTSRPQPFAAQGPREPDREAAFMLDFFKTSAGTALRQSFWSRERSIMTEEVPAVFLAEKTEFYLKAL